MHFFIATFIATFQRRVAPLALIAALGCDRPGSRAPSTDSGAAAADTVIAASVERAPRDTAVPVQALPPADRAAAQPAGASADSSRPPGARATSAAITPPKARAAARPGRNTAQSADSAVASTRREAPVPDQSVSPLAVPPPVVLPPARRQVPFAPGEKLTYDVRFGPLKVGTGTMEVSAIDTVRGREVYHTTFRIKGGTLVYKVNDRYESWFDTQSLVSLRYRQDIDEGSYERERIYEIFPDRAVFSENGKTEQASVTEPLDDGSFIYFIRSIPLEVGKTYEFNRYFRPDRNPVTIRVLRRERVRVPAGSFDAVVVRPVIKAKGIFSEGGRAELWLADDSTRVMLQLQSKLSFGSLNLYLTRIRRP